MLRPKLLTAILLLLPLHFHTQLALAADDAGDTDVKASSAYHSKMDSDSPAKREENKVDAWVDSKKNPKKIIAFEKVMSNLALRSSFGFMRAFYKKKNLRANGFADVKASYLTSLWKKKIATTFHYLPVSIASESGVGRTFQAYKGSLEVFAVGIDADLSFTRSFDFLSSLEVGAFRTSLTELIPITQSKKPLPSAGTIAILGATFLFKPSDSFKVGPRLTVGGGPLSFLSLAVDCSFYF